MALNAVFHSARKIVAQEIEAEFVVRAVSDVAGIGLLPGYRPKEFFNDFEIAEHIPLLVGFGVGFEGWVIAIGRVVEQAGNGKSQGVVNLTHPDGVAFREVIVHGNDVRALAGQAIQISRECGGERLTLAGHHLGDFAVVKRHTAYKLDVKMPLIQNSFARFPHKRKSARQDFVQISAIPGLFAQLPGFSQNLLIGQFLDFGFERVYKSHLFLVTRKSGIGKYFR